MIQPAYRIQTPRLVLRCWDPTDAPGLAEAVTESLDDLLPWMPWASNEPESIDRRVRRLRRFRASFDLDKDFVYGVFDEEESRILGSAGLHRTRRGPRHIGYWIRSDRTGRGYATEAAAALTQVAFEILEVDRVEIRCDPENQRSSAVPRRLGFTLEATLRDYGTNARGEPRDTMIWRMLRGEIEGSEAASVEVKAFDALGRTLL